MLSQILDIVPLTFSITSDTVDFAELNFSEIVLRTFSHTSATFPVILPHISAITSLMPFTVSSTVVFAASIFSDIKSWIEVHISVTLPLISSHIPDRNSVTVVQTSVNPSEIGIRTLSVSHVDTGSNKSVRKSHSAEKHVHINSTPASKASDIVCIIFSKNSLQLENISFISSHAAEKSPDSRSFTTENIEVILSITHLK